MTVTASAAYDREHHFLLTCVRSALGLSKEAGFEEPDGLDWQRFGEIAYRHRVTPLAVAGLGCLAPGTVPEDTTSEFAAYTAGYRLRSHFLAGELLAVLSSLSEAGVVCVPYKGPALAALLYKDIGLRPSGDLDIIVHESDVIKTWRMLEGLGYKLWGYPRGWRWRAYHFSFTHRERDVLLQLHWRFQPPGFPFRLGVPETFNRRQLTTLLDEEVPTLAPEDLIVILSVHAAKHLFDRLIWLCDLARLAALPGLDWQAVEARARKAGVLRMVSVALGVADAFFDLDVAALDGLLERDREAREAIAYHTRRCLYEPRVGIAGEAQVAHYRRLREHRRDALTTSLARRVGVLR